MYSSIGKNFCNTVYTKIHMIAQWQNLVLT